MARCAFVLAAVVTGCWDASETSTVTRRLEASDLQLKWNASGYSGDGTKSAGGDVVIDSPVDRAAALTHGRTMLAVACEDHEECIRHGYVVLSVRLCADVGCGYSDLAALVGWEALLDRYMDELLAQREWLEDAADDQEVRASWIHRTFERHREKLDELRAAAEDNQAAADLREDLIESTYERLGAMAAQVEGEEQVRLAETKRRIREVERITAAYEDGLDALRAPYAEVAARHRAFRDTEAAVFAALTDVASSASAAELAQIAALKIDLAITSNAENREPQLLIIDANRVRWQLAQIQATYENALAPHAEFLSEWNLPVLDHTSAARNGMANVAAYADSRMSRVNAAVAEIYDGIRRRESALVLAAADASTRDEIRVADQAHREAAFLDEMTARVTTLWRTPPRSALGLPLLSARLREMTAFLQLDAVCADLQGPAAWRGPGCELFAMNATKARTYVTTTLPFTLRFGVKKMRTAGYDEAVLADIEAKLAAGDVVAAVHAYDALLRAAEEG